MVVTFQLALTNNVTDGSFTWTTISKSMGLSYARGQQNEYGRMETGTSNVLVGDAVSALDPNNPASPYYPNVRRMRPMRAVMTVGGVDYPLFQHFVERLPRSASLPNWTQRSIQGTDAFGALALAGLAGRSYPAETSGARWRDVLIDYGWPAGRRNIDTGNSTLDALAFGNDDGSKMLDHLLDVVDSENGFGFFDASGNARFIERHAFIKSHTAVATFADGKSIATGSYPGAIPYVDLQPESTDLVNKYTGSRAGGTPQAVSDSASVAAYGPRSQDVSFLLDSDAEVADALAWRLSQTKEPSERIDGITVMPGLDNARWASVLGIEVGARVLVVEWPPGFTAPVETLFIVRYLAANIPVPATDAAFTFQLTPAAPYFGLVLDDATLGHLDAGLLAY